MSILGNMYTEQITMGGGVTKDDIWKSKWSRQIELRFHTGQTI